MAKFENKLKAIYSQAEVEILQKMDEFTEKFKVKDAIHRQELADGKITQEDYDNWLRGQVFQGKRWTAKREEIARVLYNANSVAMGEVNNEKKKVFAFNSNYQAYELEHTGGVNFGFDLYDATTVERLIREEPSLLPPKKMDPAKDIPWNMRNITREVTQGIIQGESLQEIANRIARETGSTNQRAMIRSARTAMTGAQNSGRNVRLREARDKGINVMKQWMATLDGRTRDSHRDMDGEKIKVGDKWHHYKFSNGCEYPGDPKGPPREVYNCRCTLVGDIEDYPAEYERYDNIDGKPIANMTYREWEKTKRQQEQTPKDDKFSQARKDAAFWARSSRQADDMFRSYTGQVWKDASNGEKKAAYEYTGNSDGFNQPLRGYKGRWSNFVGVGQVPLDYSHQGQYILDLTKLLDKSELQQDTWLQRGVSSMEGVSNFLGLPVQTLRNATQEELEQLLLGKEVRDAGFMSCGSARGQGFSGDAILNIFCPKGTHAMYLEPISVFGDGDGLDWDGESGQYSFGGELETLLQRNSGFVITKVEKSKYGPLYIDIDLVDQDPYGIDYKM